jgi:hypothetical protein
VEEGASRKFKRTCLPAPPRAITRRWRGGPAPQAAGRLTRRSCLMLGERQPALLPGGGVSKPVATAAVLNLMIAVVEAAAGVRSGSVSLLVDSVHHLSDEMALILLFLAFIPPAGKPRHDFVDASADVSRLYRIGITLRVCIAWLSRIQSLCSCVVGPWCPVELGYTGYSRLHSAPAERKL